MPSDQTLSIQNPASIIDVIAHDAGTDEVVLIMNEPRDWSGGETRLCELQERFNAYVSFLLDGELAEAHPELGGKRARIEVRCAYMPDSKAVELFALIHDQLEFQDIGMEVIVPGEQGAKCGCNDGS